MIHSWNGDFVVLLSFAQAMPVPCAIIMLGVLEDDDPSSHVRRFASSAVPPSSVPGEQDHCCGFDMHNVKELCKPRETIGRDST